MPFKEALAAAVGTLKALEGISVTLRRGDLTATITAVKGASEIETLEDGEVRAIAKATDWLVEPADYKLGGQVTKPKPGDLIEETDGGTTYKYEVDAEVAGANAWEWSDQHRTRLRIHTSLARTA